MIGYLDDDIFVLYLRGLLSRKSYFPTFVLVMFAEHTYSPLIEYRRRAGIRVFWFEHDFKPCRDVVEEIRLLEGYTSPWVRHNEVFVCRSGVSLWNI